MEQRTTENNIIILFDEKSQFNSLVWGSLTLTPIMVMSIMKPLFFCVHMQSLKLACADSMYGKTIPQYAQVIAIGLIAYMGGEKCPHYLGTRLDYPVDPTCKTTWRDVHCGNTRLTRVYM